MSCAKYACDVRYKVTYYLYQGTCDMAYITSDIDVQLEI